LPESNGVRPTLSFAKLDSVMEMPRLLGVQIDSFQKLLEGLGGGQPSDEAWVFGLDQVFRAVFPVESPARDMELEYVSASLGQAKYTVGECLERGMTYSAPLTARLRLVHYVKPGRRRSRKVKNATEKEVYLGDLPLLTPLGTFVVHGAERVVVSQLHRSPGVYFEEERHSNGSRLHKARIIPFRGSWVDFTVDINNVAWVHIDKKKKFTATTLLRALGYESNSDICACFLEKERVDGPLVDKLLAEDVADAETGEVLFEDGQKIKDDDDEKLARAKTGPVQVYRAPDGLSSREAVVKNTLQKDPTKNGDDALKAIYRLLRPGEASSAKVAWTALERVFFDPKFYDLGRVGRYKINQRLGQDVSGDVLAKEDFVAILRYLFDRLDGRGRNDDIDHLGNRRVRTAGELIANHVSMGLSRMSRLVRERMSSSAVPGDVTIDHLVNARTVSAVIQQFFGSSQLSQYMDQTNPLAELTHKRRLSALGPGGLTRERAGFEVRDVHYSQYGRVCPIETPEGANIGLITSLATHARINELGFVETPYRKVHRGRVTQRIEWLSANEEQEKTIAQANAPLKDDGRFHNEYVLCRHQGDFPQVRPQDIDYIDVAPIQLVSVAAALIPFLEHDDANRALMGSNMQRQAVPLLHTEAPVVGTGLEGKVARDSGAAVTANRGGRVRSVSADEIIIDTGPRRSKAKGPLAKLSQLERYALKKFARTNQDTAVNERPLVNVGDRVKAGAVIADGPCTDRGRLALGRNVQVAFMPWYGYNFEDAIVISERLVRDDVFTSVHIQELDLHVRDTKLGPEEITREIPNVTDDALLDLDEHGIVRVGAHVRSGDVLCGKITPKGEKELSPEEKLLTAIFGDKAKDVKDSSLRVPPGMTGTVIDVRVFSRQPNDRLLEVEQGRRIGELRTQEREMIRRIHAARDVELKKLLRNQAVALCLKRGTVDPFLEENEVFTPELLRKLDFRELELGHLKVQNQEASKAISDLIQAAQDRIVLERERTEEQIDRAYKPDELSPGVIQLVRVYVAAKRKLSVGDKMAGRHGNKGIVARIAPVEDMPFLPDGTSVDIVLNPLGVPSRMNVGQILETHLGWASDNLGIAAQTPVFHGAVEDEIAFLLKLAGVKWASEALGAGVEWPLRADDYLALLATVRAHPDFRRIKVSEERANGADPMTALGVGKSLDEYVENADEPARALLKTVAEFVAASSEAAAKQRGSDMAAAFPEAATLKGSRRLEKGLEAAAQELMADVGVLANGKVWLRDGRSGKRFDFPVTVGEIYMLKLSHLVDDKIHARSIGPYSLVTQQPLAGKAQFGGQRFGEMEVWALEAYGAAHTLQEILTVKSDDMLGRTRSYEAMVKGENLPKPGIPESFNVLVKEMQALGLAVELGQEGRPPRGNEKETRLETRND